ncbi:MAG: ABC transporter permease [Micromonosporaceae bacterium]|jgi:NitT/TauT family transport system permease protein|nr:ABC transporter permease [Micromonosporaceae bacterium]
MAADLVLTDKKETSGRDALETAVKRRPPSRAARIWAGVWPKALAVAIFLAFWQIVVWTGWRPDYLLPGPAPVFQQLGHDLTTLDLWRAIGTTMQRGVAGFALAAAVGLAVGLAVARSRILRSAIGSMITALQTMPSIAWFPLAILLFRLTESAIGFVIVLGAAPSIANGVIAGVDYVPPILLRAGRNIGAHGIKLYQHVIAPAALPWIVAGLKQGWAFAWRSLMAGELLVIIASKPSVGVRLQFAREFADASSMIATMIVILVIGLLVDVAFSSADRRIRARWGVLDQAGR